MRSCKGELMARELLYLPANSSLCGTSLFFFYHQFSKFNYQWSCHGSTPGHRSSALENSLFGQIRNTALSVEETSAAARINNGIGAGSVGRSRKNMFLFMNGEYNNSRPLSNQRTEGILKRSFTGGDQKASKSFPIRHNPIDSATAFLCNSGHHCPVPCSVHSARGPCGRAYGTGPQLRAWPLPLLAPLPMWHALLVWQVMHARGVEVVEVVVVLEADKRK